MANHHYSTKNGPGFSKRIKPSYPIDLAEIIKSKPPEEQILAFNALSKEKEVAVFEYLPFNIQKRLLKALPAGRVHELLNAISPDDRTALLEALPMDQMNQLLKYLSPEERSISLRLLGYHKDSVGRLMTPDYLAINMEWTVKQVLDYIRKNGQDSETINVLYAVDDNGILIDDFRLKQFLFTSLDTKVKDLADYKFIALDVNDDEEKAINIFRKYDRIALPVIDSKGIMLGIVTIDDILDVTISADTEDMHRIGGTQGLREPYLETPFLDMLRKRAGWLVFIFIGEMLTASVLGYYEHAIEKAVVLALFLPLIISSGGNSGSQASTLVVRALALGEIKLGDWWRIIRRELASGACLGIILGTIGFLRISLWSTFSSLYGPHWFLVASTIFLALIGVVMWGTLSGALLPICLKACRFDPAIASSPLIATMVDVTGLIIYFGTALIVLHGTLL